MSKEAYDKEEEINNKIMNEKIKRIELDILNKKTPLIEALLREEDLRLNEYKPIKISHVFTAFIYNNANNEEVVAFSLHTSKEKFSLFNRDINNIKIDEELNPILYTNVMHVMKLNDFKNSFTITEPSVMLNNPRYGVKNAEDMAYFALRAGVKSISNGVCTINLVQDKFISALKIDSKFLIDKTNQVLTPTLSLINMTSTDGEIIQKIISDYVNDVEYNKDNWD